MGEQVDKAAKMTVRLRGDSMWLWCPGCEDSHRIVVFGTNGWTWNKSTTAPTIEPSIKVTGVQWPPESGFHKPSHATVAAGDQTVCHSFLRDGRWEFLSDSTHVLAGQAVPMVPLPVWMADDE